MTNAIINLNLEDVAHFITDNDPGNREGYGILEVGDLITDATNKLGIEDESTDWDKAWEIINEAVSRSFQFGMQAGAQLQVQLLIGGKS